jgi:hypothetical protein
MLTTDGNSPAHAQPDLALLPSLVVYVPLPFESELALPPGPAARVAPPLVLVLAGELPLPLGLELLTLVAPPHALVVVFEPAERWKSGA